MPFELRPEPEPTLRPEGDYLQRAWAQSIYPMAERMGVPIVLPAISPQPHTHTAFEGYQYAKENAKGDAYNHRVLVAFFVEGRNIGDPEILSEIAADIGLDRDEFDKALRDRRYAGVHRAALVHAYHEAGVTGVPMFVIGDRTLVGMQSAETLAAAIDEQAGRAVRP